MKKKKNKKPKVSYIDDGRSLADMSAVGGRRLPKRGTSASFGEIWSTYWSAVRMMVKPMLVVIACLCAVYTLLALAFRFM